jgi:cell division protein FtsW
MNNIPVNIKGDRVIWAVVILLSVVSILVVYSSVITLAYKHQGGNAMYYLFKHGLIIGMGILLMYLTHKVKFSYYSRLSQIALFISVPLLLFTLMKGANLNAASRWLEIPGTGLTFQTSDFAKLALIAYLARMLAIKQNDINNFKGTFLPIVIPIIVICGLILPANFSTAAALFATSFILMFIGRVPIKHLGILSGSAILFFALFVGFIMLFPHISNRVETWHNRIENFISGEEGTDGNYQAEQAKIAIATGGVVGKGPGQSTQRNFLPHPYSDFIYAIIIEEYGFGMGILIILLYLILLFRGIKIASKSEKNFGSFLAIGCCFSLVFQAMINMGVAVNLFPVTGQPLPLVSMGGTSIWFTSIAIGIIVSVSKESETA